MSSKPSKLTLPPFSNSSMAAMVSAFGMLPSNCGSVFIRSARKLKRLSRFCAFALVALFALPLGPFRLLLGPQHLRNTRRDARLAAANSYEIRGQS